MGEYFSLLSFVYLYKLDPSGVWRVDELEFSCELAIFIPLLGEAACDGRINISAQIQMVADHMMSTFLEELIIQSLKINLR